MAFVKIGNPKPINISAIKQTELPSNAAVSRLQPAQTKSATSYLSSAARKRGFAFNVSSMGKKK